MEKTSPSELMIRQRLAALSRALPRAEQGDVQAIHQTRVATRRLREALPLVASGMRGHKLERGVRRITRALGPVRELDVALLNLEEIEAEGGVPKPGIARLRQIIREERQALHGQARRLLAHGPMEKLRKRTVAAARKGGGKAATAARDPKRLASARERAARRATSLRAAIESAAGIYLPDRLHEVRIAVKKLRYAMEVANELSRSRATASLRTLKHAQDLLGRMHDLEILIARTRAIQGTPNGTSLRVSADLDRLVRRLETECRQLHGHYMASRRKLLAICDRVEAAQAARVAASPAA
jgi:CHAD domain-containing protein